MLALSRASVSQACDQAGHIRGERRFEPELTSVGGMTKGEPMRMERLAGELDGAQVLRTVHVPLLTDQRVPSETRLQPDLIALPCFELHFDQ